MSANLDAPAPFQHPYTERVKNCLLCLVPLGTDAMCGTFVPNDPHEYGATKTFLAHYAVCPECFARPDRTELIDDALTHLLTPKVDA